MSAPKVGVTADAALEAAAAHTEAQQHAQAALQHLDDTRAKISAGDQSVSPADLREAADRAEHAILSIDHAAVEAKATDTQHQRAKAAAAAARAVDDATGLDARDAAVGKAEAEITAAVRKLRTALSARDELITAVAGDLWAAHPHFLEEVPDNGVLPDGYRTRGHDPYGVGPDLTIGGQAHYLSTHDHQLEQRIGASVRAAIAEPIPGGGENQDQMPSGFRGETVAQSLR